MKGQEYEGVKVQAALTFFVVIGIHGDKDILHNQLQQENVENQGACAIDRQLRGFPSEDSRVCAAGE